MWGMHEHSLATRLFIVTGAAAAVCFWFFSLFAMLVLAFEAWETWRFLLACFSGAISFLAFAMFLDCPRQR